jgi:Raf kinase inhibitor-like YbhB/YbcL family protein
MVFVPVVLASSTVAIACSSDGREMRPPTDAQNETVFQPSETTVVDSTLPAETAAPTTMSLTAPWVDGGVIPAEHTCAGADEVPGLSWSGVPAGTKSIAIVVIESTRPTDSGVGFVHLAAANIEPSTVGFATGSLPDEAIVAANDFSTDAAESVGWRGPCPTAGATGTYSVEVHALDQMIELPTGTPGADMVRAIDFATIASASVVGTVTGA